MTCLLCEHGQTHPGHTTMTLERDGATVVVIRDVPAEVCENCGEYYLAEDVTSRVLGSAEDAVRKHAEIEVLRYAA